MGMNTERQQSCRICDVRTEILKSVLHFIKVKDKKLSKELSDALFGCALSANEELDRTFQLKKCKKSLEELFTIAVFLVREDDMFIGGVYSLTDKKIVYPEDDTSNMYDGIPFIL